MVGHPFGGDTDSVSRNGEFNVRCSVRDCLFDGTVRCVYAHTAVHYFVKGSERGIPRKKGKTQFCTVFLSIRY